MNDLKLNAAAADNAANQLKHINRTLSDQFVSVQKAIKDLNDSWESKAATNAISRFEQISKNYAQARFSLMEQYADCLAQQIVPGYEETEANNNDLADAFK